MGFNLRRGLTASIQKENANEMSKLSNKTPVDGKVDLNSKRVCITGTITGLTRLQAQAKLKKMYPKVTFDDHITGYTDYLVTGFGIGQTKIKAAQDKGIPMIEAVKLFK